ncbi:MAG: class I SAM-dependent methyltransferase [Candidatus Saccharimonadales bacterium]
MDTVTIATYNNQAAGLSAYFRSVGARVEDIERAIMLSGRASRAVEIGCGDGRDAAEIIKRVERYEGFDPSSAMLALAKDKLPSASFVLADAVSYQYPRDVDIIFAFASLLHINRADMRRVIRLAADCLRPGGIFYISLKWANEYHSAVKKDKFGERLFYFYSPDQIKRIAASRFSIVWHQRQTMSGTEWFSIALKKI